MKVTLIAITGGSGAGKSWLADHLARRLGSVAGRISLDDFYLSRSGTPLRDRAKLNFDHPKAIDWALFQKCIATLRRGETARLPKYSYRIHNRLVTARPVVPRPLFLVEGLWLLRTAALRRLFALSVFVDCAPEKRLARRLKRDLAHRARRRASVIGQFKTQVAPMHDRFVAPQAKHADLVFQSPIRKRDVDLLETHLRLVLELPSALT